MTEGIKDQIDIIVDQRQLEAITKFDVPKTPFQRILESEFIPAETKKWLQRIKDSLDPFELQQQMVEKIKAIIKKVNHGAVWTSQTNVDSWKVIHIVKSMIVKNIHIKTIS